MDIKRQYENIFILDPTLTKEKSKNIVDSYKKHLQSQGAKIINVEEWGIKKLAYPINHKKNGFYVLLEFKVDPKKIGDLELKMKRDEKIMRFLTVKMDKNAIEYSKKRLSDIKEQKDKDSEEVEKKQETKV